MHKRSFWLCIFACSIDKWQTMPKCRERAASMYDLQPYITAVGFVELPYLLAQALVFVPISYFLIGKALSILTALSCHHTSSP